VTASRPPQAVSRQGANQGALKKQLTGLGVVGWFLRGQKSTRAGQIFCEIFYRVLELPLPKNPKNVINKFERKIGFRFFVDFFVKTFREDFLVNRFV
jgi:hypothetical protein